MVPTNAQANDMHFKVTHFFSFCIKLKHTWDFYKMHGKMLLMSKIKSNDKVWNPWSLLIKSNPVIPKPCRLACYLFIFIVWFFFLLNWMDENTRIVCPDTELHWKAVKVECDYST